MNSSVAYRFPPDFPDEAACISFVEGFFLDWKNGRESFSFKTSGSTGIPKEIMIPRTRMLASAEATVRALGLQPDYTFLVCLDTRLIAGAMMLVRALAHGMNLIITPPVSNPLKLLNASDRTDFAAFVPYQLENILSDKGTLKKLNSLKVLIAGGAPVSLSLEKKIRELVVPPVFQTYGMTETVTHIALRKINHGDSSPEYKVLPGIQIRSDERGCLVAKGSVTGNEEVITNDLIEITGHGTFRWLGRADHVINSAGIKITAENIELLAMQALASVNRQRRVMATGKPDELLGEKVILLIEGEEFELSGFEKEFRDLLPKYHFPKEILFIQKFAETASGKIDRRKIREAIK